MTKHFMPRRNALYAAVFFALFEGVFWKYGVHVFTGDWVHLVALVIAVYCFSLFITHAGREVRDE